MNFELTYQSSLAKIFPDRAPAEPPLRLLTAWQGERVHFQVAFRPDFSWGRPGSRPTPPCGSSSACGPSASFPWTTCLRNGIPTAWTTASVFIPTC